MEKLLLSLSYNSSLCLPCTETAWRCQDIFCLFGCFRVLHRSWRKDGRM